MSFGAWFANSNGQINMCGISGIIVSAGNQVAKHQIEKITDIISHRGPDGFGYFLENNLAFGHRRLAIIDLSENGHQPMHFGEKYVITFNGEIYNYIEVREELLTLGYAFKSKSDTEVILAAYDQWGDQCVNKFNGMWAFAIYDRTSQTVFCSRDRFGVKPFYYTQASRQFVFGSEIKQLLELKEKRAVNKQILIDYLVLGMEDHSEQTFFEGIYKLLPAHNLLYDLQTNTYQIQRYYSIAIDHAIRNMDEKSSIELYRKEFQRSIVYRLRSDVKVATCLSGGLDSSSIATLASDLYKTSSGNRFSAVTAKSIDKETDEAQYARIVVDKSDLDWHLVEPGTDDFFAIIDEVIRVQEEPFGGPSIMMQYFVFKKAKEIKSTVMLDGQGGDETLLGYERYYPAYLLSLPWHKRIIEFIESSNNSRLSKQELLKYYLYFTNYRIRLKRQLKRSSFVKKEFLSLVDRNLVKTMASTYSNITDMQLLEITKTQLPHLLRYEDKNSMRHSIESRLPFLDYILVELSLSINNEFKIHKGWTKYILRKALENTLSKEITWRKNKIGFEAPWRTWLNDKEFFVQQLHKSKIISTISDREFTVTDDVVLLWRLYNIARWEELYKVEIN
jgi:asparagine synthase (glutamine-hydrolysing)